MGTLMRAMAAAAWGLAWIAAADAGGPEASAQCKLEVLSAKVVPVPGTAAPYMLRVCLRVRGGDGRLVRGLDGNAFRFSLGSESQAGQPATAFRLRFDGTGAPCIALVVQTAGGPPEQYVQKTRPAVAELVRALGTAAPEARFGLVAAGIVPKVLVPAGAGAALVLDQLPAAGERGGRPATLEALMRAGDMLPRESPAKAIVAFTDGDPGPSRRDPALVTRRALEADCPVFLVNLGAGDRPLLASIDEQTRGQTFPHATKAEDMAQTLLHSMATDYAFESAVNPRRIGWLSSGAYLNIQLAAPDCQGFARVRLAWPKHPRGGIGPGVLVAIGGLLVLSLLGAVALAVAVRSSRQAAPAQDVVEGGAEGVAEEFTE